MAQTGGLVINSRDNRVLDRNPKPPRNGRRKWGATYMGHACPKEPPPEHREERLHRFDAGYGMLRDRTLGRKEIFHASQVGWVGDEGSNCFWTIQLRGIAEPARFAVLVPALLSFPRNCWFGVMVWGFEPCNKLGARNPSKTKQSTPTAPLKVPIHAGPF